MRVGCHVSIAGGVSRAPGRAAESGCTAFQVFTRNPRGWAAKEIPAGEAEAFRSETAAAGMEPRDTCAHMPYLPNLASTDGASHARSVAALVSEVERCGALGIPALVTHLGSHLGAGEEAGMAQLAKAYSAAARVRNGVTILLENTAGQKNSVGSDFGQLARILDGLRPARRFGACIDTCHAFAYGYDMRGRAAARAVLDEVDSTIGMDRVGVFHLNDAKAGPGSRLDRHHHVGLGGIGEEGMAEAAREAARRDVPAILETPTDSERGDAENVRAARAMAGS